MYSIDTMKTSIDYCQLKIGNEGVIEQVQPNGKWVARDGANMYKFRICVKNNATGKIEEG